MPYESFKCSHHLTIRGLVQEPHSGAWRFLLQVKRTMEDDNASPTTLAHRAAKQRNDHGTQPQARHMSDALSPCASHIYTIRRTYAEFKRLHAAISPLMAGAPFPNLPVESMFTFFVRESQTMLQKRRVSLDAMLKAIEHHAPASESAEYLEFLAKTEKYEQLRDTPPSPVSAYARRSSSLGHDWNHSSHTKSFFGLPPSALLPRRRNSQSLLFQEIGDDEDRDLFGYSVDAKRRRHTIQDEMENCVELSRFSMV